MNLFGKKELKVSVILPNYNSSKTIKVYKIKNIGIQIKMSSFFIFFIFKFVLLAVKKINLFKVLY